MTTLVLTAALWLAAGPRALAGSVTLTDAEKAWLAEHPVIRLAPDPDFRPIEFFNARGQYDGAAADVVHLLERRIGLRFTIVRLRNWDEAMARFRAHEVDVLGAMVRTPNREKFALFTDTLVEVPGGIFARQGAKGDLALTDLADKNVAVVSNYTAHDVLRDRYPKIRLVVVPDVTAGLSMASLGAVDAYVENMANATWYSQQAGITNLQMVGRTDFNYRWGIGIRRDWEPLQTILNKGLAALEPAERAEALDRWIAVRAEGWRPSREVLVGAALTALLILFAMVLLWVRSLRLTVDARTAELSSLAEQLELRVAVRTAELSAEVAERQRAAQEALASEERLRESESLYHSLVESLPQSLFRKDLEGRFVFANSSFCELLGRPAEEVVGRRDDDFYPPELADKYRADDQRVLAGETFSSVEEHILPDGRRLTVEVVKLPLRDGDGRVVGVQGIFTDISERVHLEAQYRQAQRLESVGRLAGGVAHDLNNLLSPILGYSEMLLGALGPESPHHADVTEVLRAAQRAAELTGQLLAVSRKQVLRMAPVDLVGVVAGFQQFLRRAIREDVAIEYDCADQPIMVLADAGQLEQVLMNLVVNAQDAMPDGGTVTITVTEVEQADSAAGEGCAGRCAMLRVSDTGEGVDPAIMAYIFEPFFTTKGPGRGTGLGLATVYGIVEQHSGHISCTSEPGRGSAFTVCLPLTEQRPPEPAPAAVADEASVEAVVAVVDDDDAARRAAARRLRHWGYQVIEADGGPALLAALADRESPIDLLLTDVVMPHMTGRQVSDTLTARWPGLRVLFMSGYPEDVLSRRGVLEPGVRLLPKPFGGDALATAVRDALRGA